MQTKSQQSPNTCNLLNQPWQYKILVVTPV